MTFNTQPMLTLSNILTKTKEEVNLESLRFLKKKIFSMPIVISKGKQIKISRVGSQAFLHFQGSLDFNMSLNLG